MIYAVLNKPSGFSLAEVLVALALLATLAGIGLVGRAQSASSTQVRNAAHQVAADLRIARLRSITDQTDHRLVFEPGARTYQRQRLGPDGFADDESARALPHGVVIQSATSRVVSFRPRGNATSFGTIRLATVEAATRDVVVNIAGHVSIR